ncbi:MAG: FlgD immunoglobulin-like domain containing protein [Candidatus Cloacimonadota bacterium]|nr:FlgD immunoglobulin-like domain containing protein [Candidatus Cloacimonadota bacterium]
MYFISQTIWPNSTYYNGIGSSGPFGNGYIPLFAVIGALNVCYYNGNYFSNVQSALDTAIETFGLTANFDAVVTNGPANLGVQFIDHSFSPEGIDSWEWDLDGDGTIDSTEPEPFLLYTEIGSYDVILTVTSQGESVTKTSEDFITVTDGSAISGEVAGIWTQENNPYYISDDTSIPVDAELTIEPGVTINVAPDKMIEVKGKLVADAIEDISNPIIITSDENWKGFYVFNSQQDNIIRGCKISKATDGAIRIDNSHVQIIKNVFFENESSSKAAAIDVNNSDTVLVRQNIIANNTSGNLTGGIQCVGSAITVENNIFANNSGTFGAAVLKSGSDANFVNNTFINNESTNGTPYLFFLFNAFPTFYNCIIQEDVADLFFAPYGPPTITYTCITSGFEGEGNIDEDPLFIAPTAGIGTGYDALAANWALQTGSPCIDAGTPDPDYFDLDGSRNDMGAFGGPTPYENICNAIGEPQSEIAVGTIQSFPNPFMNSSTISYALQNAKNVNIAVYNIKGERVRTLVSGFQSQGEHNTTWNGNDSNGNQVSSGLYFYRLKAGNNTQIINTILLR